MMKKTIWISLASINLVLVVILVALAYLSIAHPLRPGDGLFIFQEFAERNTINLSADKSLRAHMAIDLAERRLTDLAMAREPVRIQAAGIAFNNAMEEVASALDELDEQKIHQLENRLGLLLEQAKIIVERVDPYMEMEIVKALHARLQASIELQEGELVKKIWVEPIAPLVVPFLGDDYTAEDHTTYALLGHAEVPCMDCHMEGEYKGTPTECHRCHVAPNDRTLADLLGSKVFVSLDIIDGNSQQHYSGECSDCHSTYSWAPNAFDHQYYVGCQNCHEMDLPELSKPYGIAMESTHYRGDCIICHQDVVDWTVAEYDHQGTMATNCTACHDTEVPRPHYYGIRCDECHKDMSDWNTTAYEHRDDDNCLSCHQGDAPFKHYDGQCSNCHETETWDYSGHPDNRNCVSCHHPEGQNDCHACHADRGITPGQGYACTSCHQNDDHYPGACKDCHTTKNWSTTSYNHAGAYICQNCHDSIESHYPGECSQCHTPDSWTNLNVNHEEINLECSECHNAPAVHYTGECTWCHTSSLWGEVTPDHEAIMTSYADCSDCHASPTDHYPGSCTWCHADNTWSNVAPNHEYYTSYECDSCHSAPQGHWPGACSSCHIDSENWLEYTFDHTGYSNCKACHAALRPPVHPRGQCSKCHTTDGWGIIVTPTPSNLEVVVITETVTNTLGIKESEIPEPEEVSVAVRTPPPEYFGVIVEPVEKPTLVPEEQATRETTPTAEPTEIITVRPTDHLFETTPEPPGVNIIIEKEIKPPEQAMMGVVSDEELDVMSILYLVALLLLTTGMLRVHLQTPKMNGQAHTVIRRQK